MERISPHVLLLSTKHDYSTDHVVWQLRQLGLSYVRLNRDQLPQMQLELEPTPPSLVGKSEHQTFEITSETLRSIYFRAPVFLRDNYQPSIPPEEQFARSQWAAFIRALTVFDSAFWINHPTPTYQAEIKPLQLATAAAVGFRIPRTVVTNSAKATALKSLGSQLATKVLDGVVLRVNEQEGFIYTHIVTSGELAEGEISSAPIIVQEAIVPKVDIRVTVVGDRAFAAEIVSASGDGFSNDWRINKSNIQYRPITLPSNVENRCLQLVRKLGLVFGGIDLALRGGEYFFIEINPTGEWAWLMPHTKYPIDYEIANMLAAGNNR
ncbi:MAG: hypothetical protein JNK76_08500 [Planctomycetales bacterium]|nr:hypothetical protein [Planctomycetales bacterium]